MPDAPEVLYHDHLFAELYDAANPSSDDHDFCLRFAKGRGSVLDLGCGTGTLASIIARTYGCHVTGVDPARAMLDQARHHEGYDQVQWVHADAREVRLGRRFDLIVMTGHAFQCLLTRADQLAVLRTIAVHLAPRGEFIFDTRNPLAKAWLGWTPQARRDVFRHPKLGDVEASVDSVFDPATQIATYEWFYKTASGAILHAPASRIAFPSCEQLAALIGEAGLHATRWMGEWDGRPFADGAPEIIPIGTLNQTGQS